MGSTKVSPALAVIQELLAHTIDTWKRAREERQALHKEAHEASPTWSAFLEIEVFADAVAGHVTSLLKNKQRRGELPPSLLDDPMFFAWFKANRSAYPVMCGYVMEMDLIRTMVEAHDPK